MRQKKTPSRRGKVCVQSSRAKSVCASVPCTVISLGRHLCLSWGGASGDARSAVGRAFTSGALRFGPCIHCLRADTPLITVWFVYRLTVTPRHPSEAANERKKASAAQKQARKAQKQAAAAQDEVTALRQQLEALQSQLQQSQE